MQRRPLLVLASVSAVVLATVLGAAGCASSEGSTAARPADPRPSSPTVSATVASPRAPTPATRATATPPRTTPTKILVVIEENHSLRQMRSQMPYLSMLSDRYGYATHWRALTHPSEPNYLAIAGGSEFGVTNDAPPAVNAPKVGAAESVFSQARRAGKTAMTYAESIPHPCALTNSGDYAVRHNPWTYFSADRSACSAHDVGTAGLARTAAANRLPNVGFLIPNMAHDAHDGTLGEADAWLRTTLSPVLASHDFRSGRLVVVVTADEDDRRSGNVVLTSVLTPRLHHKVVTTELDHYSLTRFIAQVLGVRPLKQARGAADLRTAFGL